VFTAAALRDLLTAAGFDAVTMQGGFAGEPFQAGSPRLVLIASRS
jgi:hypothetical protein